MSEDLPQAKINRRQFLAAAGMFPFRKYLNKEGPESIPPITILNKDQARINPALAKFLKETVAQPPKIGGDENWDIPLIYGLGYATLHLQTTGTLKRFAQWNESPALQKASQGTNSEVLARCSTDFSGQSIAESFRNDQYAGLIALRSPKNIGQKFGVFAVEAPSRSPDITVKYVGPALVVDTAAKKDWVGPNGLGARKYKHLGWEKEPWEGLSWMVDASPSLMESLYPGVNNNPDHLNEGRGIIVVREDKIMDLLGYKTDEYKPE